MSGSRIKLVAIPPFVRCRKVLGLMARDVLLKAIVVSKQNATCYSAHHDMALTPIGEKMMPCHLIVGAVSCFGSSLFGQAHPAGCRAFENEMQSSVVFIDRFRSKNRNFRRSILRNSPTYTGIE